MDVVSKSKSDKQSFNNSVRSFYQSALAIGVVVCAGAIYWQTQNSEVSQQKPSRETITNAHVKKTPSLLNPTALQHLVDEHQGLYSSFEFNQQLTVSDELHAVKATIHESTQVSRYSGGAVDYRQLTLHQSDASQLQMEGDVHAFEFGIKDQHLIFSKPIELSVSVDYPDGTPVSIYAKHARQELGQSGLTQDFSASCSNGISSNESNQAIVQNGKVSFATCGASLFVVRDNVDNIEIDTVRGMCLNNRAFQYQVHWHDDTGTVTQVQVVDDSDMVLASGSSSPVIVNKSGSSNRTAFNIRVRDLNNMSDISPSYVVRPEDCRGFDLKTYTSDSQFTVPDNVYAIEVLAIGGGGGGQAVKDKNGGPTLAGGGGGGGASASSVLQVLPGEVYKVFVGAGGKNDVGDTKQNGEDSYFTLTNANNALVLAAGGKTPSSAETTSQTTGAAGGQASDSVGQIRFNGGDGGNGNDNSNNLKAGAGGGAGGYAGRGSDGANGFDPGRGGAANTAFFPDNAGDGGNGKISNANSEAKDGFDGNIYGGAGSGGIFGNNTSGKKADGGRGAKGAVWIRPVDSLTTATLTQTSNQQDPVLDKTTVKFSLTFGHPIDESTLTCDDFTITGAAGAVCDSITEGTPHNDTKYYIELTTTNNGPLTIAMNSNSVKDSSNNFMPTPFGGDTQMLMLGHADTTKPNVTVEQASGQADPNISDGTIVYRATFDEPIKPETFTCADIILSGSAIATCSGITEQSPNNGRVYDLQVTASTNGIATATIMSDSVNDYKDNTNNASTSTDNSVRVSTLALNRAPVLNDKTLALSENSAVGNTIWTMTLGDPDEEVLIYDISDGDPDGQFEINSSGVISVKANNALDFEAASNSFNLTVRAEDVHGASDTATVTINLTNVNEAPVISGSPAVSVNEDATYNFVPTASDVDANDGATFSITNLPSWASFSSATGQLTGTPDNGDVHVFSNIVISVTDNDGLSHSLSAFSITVNNVNDAPTISGSPTTSVNEDSAYSFTPFANDVDTGDTLAFSVSPKPSWAEFDTATGKLWGTPTNNDVGTTNNIVISVKDSADETTSLTGFNLTVNNVNDTPTISGTPVTSVNEDSVYSFTPSANDIDTGDTLTFSVSPKPSWADFDTVTGKLSGTPTNNDVGTTNNIVISVKDSANETASLAVFNLTVNNVNDAPTISGTPVTSVNEDSAYSFTPSANDVDTGDTFTFSVSPKPSWADFDTATGKLSGTPTNDDVGTTSNIVISVKDSANETASLAGFNLTVNNVNDTPTISGSPITSVNEDSAYSFTPSANDVDTGDTLTFSISATPSWATFDTTTGKLWGTPTNDDVGTINNIVISVKDSANAATSLAAFNVTVNNVNDTPQIGGVPSTSVSEGVPYQFTPSSDDVDVGDILTFEISNKPDWATFDPATGKLSGTPVNADVGTTSNIVISVKDSANATASLAAFNLTVVNVNQAPALSGGSFSIAENSTLNTNVGTALSLVDPDIGDSHTFSITNGNSDNAFKITNDGQLQVLTPSALNFEERQSFALTIEVNDGALTDTASVTVTVNDVQEISNFSIADIESTSVVENTAYQSPVAAISGTSIGNVTYSKSGDDAELFTLDTATGELGLGAKDFEAPADNDTNNTYVVKLTATDDDQNTAEKDIVITVTNFNVAPAIDKTNLTDQTQAEDFTDYTLGFTVTDADQDDITLSINNSAPTIVDVSVSPTTAIDYAAYNVGNYEIAINSLANRFGSAAIELVATDMYGVTDVASFNMTIPAVLDFPSISDKTIDLNEDFADYRVTLTDIDFAGAPELTLTIAYTGADVFEAIAPITIPSGINSTFFDLVAKANASGNANILVTVTASGHPEQSGTITAVVNAVNDAPTISGSAAVATELQAYSWTPTFDDIDNANNTLTFSQTGLPAWATLNAATGEISGTPTVNDQGSSNAVITVSDGALSANLSITINVNNVNQAPVYKDTDFTVAENSANNTLVGTHTASDIDAGDVHTYSIESGNTDNAFAIDNDGKITVNDVTALDYETNAEFTLEIKAQDNGGLSDLALVTVGLTNVNEAPTISGTAPTTIAQNAFYQFTALGNDVDAGDTLTYSATNLPSWLTIDSATGILSGTPTNSDLGDHNNITITVKDALSLSAQLAPFSVTVTDVNDLPIVTGTPALFVDEDSAYSFKLTISDLDVGDTHVISGTNIPSWLTINQATQTLEGTPRNGDVGVYSDITLTVTDSSNGSNSLAPFELTVKNTNDAPVISGVAATTVNQGVAYSFTPGVVDVDLGDSVSFSITGKPSWLAFDTATGKLSGTPSNSDVGSYSNIVITATDSNDAQNGLSAFAIEVLNVNDAPTISGVPASSVNEDTLYSFTPSILDIDSDIDSGDSHSFSATGLPSWLTLNTASGVISGTPDNSDVGSYANIVLTVQDAAGASASLPAFSVTVNNVNDAPTITGTPTTTVAQGSAYSFAAQGSDVDVGDTLTYSITNKPSWAVFNTTSGVLQGTPSNSDVGTTANIVISVQDANNQKASLAAFSVEVTNVNDAPTISGVPAGGVLQGEAYSFTPSANDIDANDELIFSATNLPSWLSLDTASGQISGVPANADVGVFANIVITAKDNANAAASLAAFTITVSNSNDAPVISGVPSISVNQDAAYSFTPSASDEDVGDELSFSIVNKPSWASFDSATGALSGTPTNSDVGATNGIVISV